MVYYINVPMPLRILLVLMLTVLFFTFHIGSTWLHWLVFLAIVSAVLLIMHNYQRSQTLALYMKIANKMGWKFFAHSERYNGRAVIDGECGGKKFAMALAPTGISHTGSDMEVSFMGVKKEYSFITIPKKAMWGLMWSKRKALPHFNHLEKRGGKRLDMPSHYVLSNDPEISKKTEALGKIFDKEPSLCICVTPKRNFFSIDHIKNNSELMHFMDDCLLVLDTLD